jgi:hypothetical protein
MTGHVKTKDSVFVEYPYGAQEVQQPPPQRKARQHLTAQAA